MHNSKLTFDLNEFFLDSERGLNCGDTSLNVMWIIEASQSTRKSNHH